MRGIRRWLLRHRVDAAIIGGVMVLGLASAVGNGSVPGPLGAAVADMFQRAAPRVYDSAAPVRIVAIDSASLERFGQWPWPRTYLATLVQRLDALGAAAIALDILVAEPDRTSPEVMLDRGLRFDPGASPGIAMPTETSNDRALARAIAAAPVVLAALPTARKAPQPPFERKFGLVASGGDPRPGIGRIDGTDRPLPALVAAASGYGLGGVAVGEGSVVRRAPLFTLVDGEIVPSLSMEALRVAQGARSYVLRTSAASAETAAGRDPVLIAVRNGAVTLPLTADGSLWIRYAGPQPERFIPASQVLDGASPDPGLAAQIEGRIVLVAVTAPGLSRPVDTPLGLGAQSAEIHAEILEQALAGTFLQRPDWAVGAESLGVVVLSLVTAVTTLGRSALTGLVIAAVLPAVVLGLAWLAFVQGGLLISPVAPALSVAVVYTLLTAVNYLRSRRAFATVRSQFERFVAPEVIRNLVADPDRIDAMKGEERPLTVMFCDARGFTAMSEAMPTEALIAYLNACFGELTDAVLAEGGTVDKYMGDCIMAFWNAPLPMADHADRALSAAFAIRAAQTRLNERFVREGRPLADFGVGLNTGPCSVGLMGSPRRLDYTCVGDTVNVASRLQDLTKHFGVWNVVSAATVRAAPGWQVAPLGAAPIRNRAERVPVFTVLGPPGAPLSPPMATAQHLLGEIEAAAASGRDVEDALKQLEGIDVPGFRGVQTAQALCRRRPVAAAPLA